MKRYKPEVERLAYNQGVLANIKDMQMLDNPYPIAAKELHLAWMKGFVAKSSIKDRTG